jgi:hypothetical protein
MLQKLNSSRVDLIIIVILLVAGWKFTFELENTLDIGLTDEGGYLYGGATAWNAGRPNPAWAPLYTAWYFILSLLEPNRIALYYLNYKLLAMLPPIIMYGVLRRNTVSIPVSLIISWLLLVSHANALAWPRVSHFALLLILATLLLVGHKRSLLWSSLFASMGALLVSYVRPEFFLTYVLSTVLFAFMFILDYKKLEKQYLLGVMAYGLFSALVLGALGLPVGGARSMIAFGQHFSVNWVYWNRSNLNAWSDWGEIISLNFESARSIPEALGQNPSAFLKHVSYNLLNFVRFTPKLFLPVNLSAMWAIVFAVLSSGLLIAHLSKAHYKSLLMPFSSVCGNLRKYQQLLIFVGLFLLPACASIIIIYPREHYVLVFVVLIVMTVAILLTNPDARQGEVNLKKVFLLCALLVFMTPDFGQSEKPVQKNLSTLQLIQSLEIDEPVNMLEAQGGYHYYLGSNFHRVRESEKNVSFDQFRVDRNINMIVVSDGLRNDSRFKADPEWQSFLVNHRQFGYLQVDIPNSHRKIIVQANLLPE